jgi:hypothetical protein
MSNKDILEEVFRLSAEAPEDLGSPVSKARLYPSELLTFVAGGFPRNFILDAVAPCFHVDRDGALALKAGFAGFAEARLELARLMHSGRAHELDLRAERDALMRSGDLTRDMLLAFAAVPTVGACVRDPRGAAENLADQLRCGPSFEWGSPQGAPAATVAKNRRLTVAIHRESLSGPVTSAQMGRTGVPRRWPLSAELGAQFLMALDR